MPIYLLLQLLQFLCPIYSLFINDATNFHEIQNTNVHDIFRKIVLVECILITYSIILTPFPFFSVIKTRTIAHTSQRTHLNKASLPHKDTL